MENTSKANWLKNNPTLLKATDLSRLLGYSQQYIYLLAKRNTIPSMKIGRSRRFRATDVLDFIEASGGKF